MTEHSHTDFELRYVDGDLPWDTGRYDRNLEKILMDRNIGPCAALEIGCGTGTNAMWLAQQGFLVTAVDIAPTAIKKARAKAEAAGVTVAFHVADFLQQPVSGAPFAFAFDRGVFHGMESAEDRTAFAAVVAGHLQPEGLWLSFIGSTDGGPRDVGPPRRSATDIVLAAEPLFEILVLAASHFDSDQEDPPQNWTCLMRKRTSR